MQRTQGRSKAARSSALRFASRCWRAMEGAKMSQSSDFDAAPPHQSPADCPHRGRLCAMEPEVGDAQEGRRGPPSRRIRVSPWERFRLLTEYGALDGQGSPIPWVRPADNHETRGSPVKAPTDLMKVQADFWRQGRYLLLERNEMAAPFAFLAHAADLVEQVDADNSIRGIDLGQRYFRALGLSTRRYRAFKYYLEPLA